MPGPDSPADPSASLLAGLDGVDLASLGELGPRVSELGALTDPELGTIGTPAGGDMGPAGGLGTPAGGDLSGLLGDLGTIGTPARDDLGAPTGLVPAGGGDGCDGEDDPACAPEPEPSTPPSELPTFPTTIGTPAVLTGRAPVDDIGGDVCVEHPNEPYCPQPCPAPPELLDPPPAPSEDPATTDD